MPWRKYMPESQLVPRCTILRPPVSPGATPSRLVIPDSIWPVYRKFRTPVQCNTPRGATPRTMYRMNHHPLTRHRTCSQTTPAGYEPGGVDCDAWESSSDQQTGTTMTRRSLWGENNGHSLNEESNPAAWWQSTRTVSCSQPEPVWCVQDPG